MSRQNMPNLVFRTMPQFSFGQDIGRIGQYSEHGFAWPLGYLGIPPFNTRELPPTCQSVSHPLLLPAAARYALLATSATQA